MPTAQRLLPAALAFLYYAVYAGFCFLMVRISLQYIPPVNDVAFLRIKQDVVHHPWYLPAFFVHALSAGITLAAGFTQFSTRLRRQSPRFHRGMGRIYVWTILIFAGPSGLLIGMYANGGYSSRTAFCLLAVLWLWSTGLAWRAARQKKWPAHRNYMIRSFALTLSAITLRAWKYILVALFHPHPMDVYRWVAWLGWTLNLLLAEVIIYKMNSRHENT